MRNLAAILVAVLLALAAPVRATTYAIPNGDGTYTYLDPSTPTTFSIGGLSFPPPWLMQASDADRAAHGILTVVETPEPDHATNAVAGRSIQLVGGVPTVIWSSTSLSSQQQAAQQYAALIGTGTVSVVSTGTPSLSGAYGITLNDKVNISSIVAGIGAGQGVPGSGSSFVYLDAAGAPHVFTAAQFLPFAKAIRDYVYSFAMAAGGQGAVPTSPITIP